MNSKPFILLLLVPCFAVSFSCICAGEDQKTALTVKNIAFTREKGGVEKVALFCNQSCTPELFSLEEENPRVVMDMKGVSLIQTKTRNVKTGGILVKGVRSYLDKQTKILRVVLDMEPSKYFTVRPMQNPSGNTYALTIQEATSLSEQKPGGSKDASGSAQSQEKRITIFRSDLKPGEQEGKQQEAAPSGEKRRDVKAVKDVPSVDQGRSQLNAGEFAAAVDTFTQILAAHPDDRLSYRLRGNAYAKLTDRQKALADWAQAARLGDTTLQSYLDSLQVKWRETPAPSHPKGEPVNPPVVAQMPPAVPVKTAQLSIPAGEMPAPLGWALAGEYALICEKESKLLHLFKFQGERFELIKSYPCVIGANSQNKKKAGDYATPKGSYFILRYTTGGTLQEIYGEGAFVLNYPNFLDLKERKDGGGIWIHGHVPGKVIGTGDLVNTKGCIAVSNDIIRELKNLLRPSGTNVSIVDKVTFVKESIRKESLQEIRNFMDAWRQAWESGDTGKYLRYYSKDFMSSDGMDFAAFRHHKERVSSSKKFISVKVEQICIVFPQEQEREMAAVRFVQRYHSNNFDSNSKKLFYLKKGQEGWTIFGESTF